MKITLLRRAGTFAFVFLAVWMVAAQEQNAPAKDARPASGDMVPRLINFNGVIVDRNERSGVAGATFLLYAEQQGGAPLWMETQNITLDKSGRYAVTLGATRGEGLPADLFSSGQARWLAVQIGGQPEQPRVLLVAVPYALKAADAQTLGGLPASAFVLAAPIYAGNVPAPASGNLVAGSEAAPPPATSSVTTTGGTTNALPLWTTATNIQSSAVIQAGSGATAKIGINNAAPVGTLDVKGSAFVRGLFSLPTTGNATATAGKNSQPAAFAASAFNSATSAAVSQTFRWQAEAAGNNTSSPSGTLNLLFAQGSGTPSETGLKIASNGRITFAAGQTFPGTGPGTVKSVGLTVPSDFNVGGSPVTSTGVLGLTWKVVPSSANAANAIVKRDGTGSFNANNITTAGAINASGTITATTGNIYGIVSNASATNATAVVGDASASSGQILGVWGTTGSASDNAAGIFGSARNFASDAGITYGVMGQSKSPRGVGVFGNGVSTSSLGNDFLGDFAAGVWGDSAAGNGAGLVGSATGDANAIFGVSTSTGPTAYFANTSENSLVLMASGPIGRCQIDTAGNLACDGTITAGVTFSKIDHPIDPANKYLVQRGLESAEAKTVYDGIAVLNSSGEAWVQLPSYAEALDENFRYQLTAVGAPGPNLYVADKISGNRFRIAGGKPGAEVSWLVTGIRHDATTSAGSQEVEPAKPAKERGYYLRPEAFGQPREKGLATLHAPRLKVRAQAQPAAGEGFRH